MGGWGGGSGGKEIQKAGVSAAKFSLGGLNQMLAKEVAGKAARARILRKGGGRISFISG